MKRLIYSIHILLLCSVCCNAQIGYQVSLLNSATGEPRTNETVSVEVEITNSENTVICSETKSATTNEFGVLSLQVGNASTFESVDWSKLPLYVSATVDGIMVGKSQILNVPVAEAAKTLVNVDPDIICRTWTATNPITGTKMSLSLSKDYSFTCTYNDGNVVDKIFGGKYQICGNAIYLFSNSSINLVPVIVVYNNNKLHASFISGYHVIYN